MKIANVWLLAAASSPPAHVDVAAIHAVLEQQKLGGDGFAAALDELQQRPVVVETLDEQQRVFSLPPGAITLRELTFGTAGLGYSVWDAGVGMSLWLSQHAEAVRGKRVLELGSGVGIAGIAAALCGGAHVTLSDYGFAADGGGAEAAARAELLRSNLEANARRSGVSERCDAVALDWHASLRQGFRPARRYEAIVGSDLCYYEDDVDALAATIVAHLQPGARAHLLSPLGRTGLPRLLSTLAERGEVTTEELDVVNNFGRTELCRVEFCAPG